MDAILEAIDAADQARSRKRAGLWGRLLGRDLVAMAGADRIDTTVRVRIAYADTHAAALEEHLAELEIASEHLQRQTTALLDAIDRCRASSIPSDDESSDFQIDDSVHRQLLHMEALIASWRITAAQLALAMDYGRSMTERYAQVRNVLLPLWRHRAASSAMSRKLREEESSRVQQLQDAVRGQIDALRQSPQPPSASIAPTPKDLLP
ncbi:MAG: hypothetical protein M3Q42_12160 [Pseudomonadota bacterium]|nr:hypothetical protein [Pseudomonadota bacterium]